MSESAMVPDITTEIPEKYHVKDDAGALNMDGTARNLAKAYKQLETRLGSVGLPPDSPDKYDLKDFGDSAANLAESAHVKKFLAQAHANGMTNKQAVGALQTFLEAIPGITSAANPLTDENGRAALKAVWTDDKAFQDNIGAGLRAIEAYAEKAGISPDDVHGAYEVEINGKKVVFPPLANHPLFARLMAAIGPEVGEARSPQQLSPTEAASWDETVAALKAHPAYSNPEHAEHNIIRSKVRTLYEKRYPEEA